MAYKNPTNELFISVDIEADGPIPIKNSMMSIGAVAFTLNKGIGEVFSENLKPLSTAEQDPDTMLWWLKNPEAFQHATKDPHDPKWVMEEFNTWVDTLAKKYNSKPIFISYPASFDHMFVYVYSHWLLGRCSFKFQALDFKSYAMAMLMTSFSDTVKRKMPERWFTGTKHSHKALDDAMQQAILFMNAMKENLGISKTV